MTVNRASLSLNRTAVVPENPLPVITTEVPAGPLVGLKDAIAGHPTVLTVKLDELVAVPCLVVTEIGPLLAPEGTWATTSLSFFRSNWAVTPLNVTLVTSLKPEPEIVTSARTHAVEGLNESIVGVGWAPAGGPTSVTSSATTAPATTRRGPVRCLIDVIPSPSMELFYQEQRMWTPRSHPKRCIFSAV